MLLPHSCSMNTTFWTGTLSAALQSMADRLHVHLQDLSFPCDLTKLKITWEWNSSWHIYSNLQPTPSLVRNTHPAVLHYSHEVLCHLKPQRQQDKAAAAGRELAGHLGEGGVKRSWAVLSVLIYLILIKLSTSNAFSLKDGEGRGRGLCLG